MQLHVKLFSRFRERLPREARGKATIELPSGTSVGHLLDHLGIAGRIQLISINGEPETDRSRPLHDGDTVHIFPFVVGG
jgi:sulfur carrier protein ThiS